jgi:hypothetical protein
MLKYDVVLSGRNSHKFRKDFLSAAVLGDTVSCQSAHLQDPEYFTALKTHFLVLYVYRPVTFCLLTCSYKYELCNLNIPIDQLKARTLIMT